MKVLPVIPSFKGVKCIGTVPFKDPDFITKTQEQVEQARTIEKIIKEDGLDTFVVKMSTKNARGQSYDGVKTYVLYDEEAKIPNQYNKIKRDLQKMFQDQIFMSDLFANAINKELLQISEQQSNVAIFIAENRKNCN